MPITAPDAAGLVDELLADLDDRYGPGDFPRPDPAVFTRARGGAFVVAYVDGIPSACGGIFRVDDATAEVKRMFTSDRVRRQGVAGAVLGALEERGRQLGYRRLRLATGARQPEAISLYERRGFARIDPYPPHDGDPLSRCYAKDL